MGRSLLASGRCLVFVDGIFLRCFMWADTDTDAAQEDYTPVCTTELGAFAKLEPEFTRRNVKLIGLSANTIESHGGWIKDIDEVSGSHLRFPIIGDKERKVAYLYDM